MCPTLCVSHFMIIPLHVYPTPYASNSVYISFRVPPCLYSTPWASHFVCIPLCICSTSWVFNSVRVSLLYLAPFVSHSYDISHSYIPLLYPTPKSHSYIPLLYPLLDPVPISHSCIPPHVSHSVFHSMHILLCVSLIIPLRVFYSLCTLLFVCRTKCVGRE